MMHKKDNLKAAPEGRKHEAATKAGLGRAARILFAAGICVLAAGCASNADFLAEQRDVTPAAWSSEMPQLSAAGAETNRYWWSAWNNAELNILLAEAARANTDVLTARANLRQAAALADEATANLFPSLNASMSGSGSRQMSTGETNESWSASAQAVWSISLAGGNIAAQRAANLEAMASAMTLEDTRIAVASEVAQTYVNLRLAYVRKRIAIMTFENYSQACDIARWHYEAGLSDRTELDQAISNMEGARAQIPLMQASIVQYRNALARLTGQAAETLIVSDEEIVPAAPATLAVSLPAETLRQRPDMRAATYSLVAASDRVYEARSQWFPNLQLTGSLGTQAAAISALGATGTGVASLLGALAMPIFDWGAQVSASEQALAALDRARASYAATLLAALEETENALTGISTAQNRETALQAALNAAISAADLAMQQYEAGLTDYQTVLNTQRSLYSARENLQSNKADLATQLINLYRAMGGGWQPDEAVRQIDERISEALKPAPVAASKAAAPGAVQAASPEA